MADAFAVESRCHGEPRVRVWAVSGGLVGYLGHAPPVPVDDEAHLAGGEYVLAAREGDVLAATRGQPERTVDINDERYGFGKIAWVSAGEPRGGRFRFVEVRFCPLRV